MRENQRKGPGSAGTGMWFQGAGKAPDETPEKQARVGLYCMKETELNPKGN